MNIHKDSIDWFLRELRERFKKKTWLWPPQYTATVSKFLQTNLVILIISADSRLDKADVFFSSTRSQAATCGLNRSWTLLRLDTSLGVSRNPGAQHVVSQHIHNIYIILCIYIHIHTV